MKFGDNLLFKAYEYRIANNDFKCDEKPHHEFNESTGFWEAIYTYRFDIGVCVVIERLINLPSENLSSEDVEKNINICCDNDMNFTTTCPAKALSYLKNKDVSEVQSITFDFKITFDFDEEGFGSIPLNESYSFDFKNQTIKHSFIDIPF